MPTTQNKRACLETARLNKCCHVFPASQMKSLMTCTGINSPQALTARHPCIKATGPESLTCADRSAVQRARVLARLGHVVERGQHVDHGQHRLQLTCAGADGSVPLPPALATRQIQQQAELRER